MEGEAAKVLINIWKREEIMMEKGSKGFCCNDGWNVERWKVFCYLSLLLFSSLLTFVALVIEFRNWKIETNFNKIQNSGTVKYG